MKTTGRTWVFGENINTDLILPASANYLTPQEQTRYVFSANRPGWVDQVQQGDILIGGRNFGMGSSRPAARSLRLLGLGCLIADSINGLFFRNCVNWGFYALECSGVSAGFQEGDEAQIDFDAFTIANTRSGQTFKATPIPERLLKITRAGGLYEFMAAEGLIDSASASQAAT